MSTLDATTTVVRKLVAEWSGSSPVTVQHLPYGHNSISFDVTLPGARVIVRTHPDPDVVRWTLTISRFFAGSLCPSRACSSTTSNREPRAFCCYDRRLSADAEAAGLNVLNLGLD